MAGACAELSPRRSEPDPFGPNRTAPGGGAGVDGVVLVGLGVAAAATGAVPKGPAAGLLVTARAEVVCVMVGMVVGRADGPIRFTRHCDNGPPS